MSQLGKILLIFSGISLFSFVVILTLVQAWVPFLYLALGFFIVFAAVGVWVDRKFFGELFTMKTTKQGFSMGTMILMVLGILIAVNFVGARRYLTLDLSSARVNSLSDQSIKLLENLKEDLRVIYFYKDDFQGLDGNRKQFIALIRKYQDRSPRIQVEFVELNSRPDLTEKYNIKESSPAVLLEYQGRTAMTQTMSEQEITSGLVKVSREKLKKVFYVTGHAELPMQYDKSDETGSFLQTTLESNRYEVKPLDFAKDSIPKDADVLMILGPKQQYLEAEVQAIEAYLAGGGSLFLALEPNTKHGLESLLARVGIKANENTVGTLVTTPFGVVPDPKFTRAGVFSPSNPITKPFGQNQFMIFRFPQALQRVGVNPPAGLQIDDLVRTDEGSYIVSSSVPEQKNLRGPFTVVMSVKGKFPDVQDAQDFQMVVAGDREFLNDQTLALNLNRDLVLNTVAVLAKEEDMVSITPKEVGRTEIILLDTSFVLYIFLFMIPLPVALYAGSLVFWWRRRNA